MEKSHDFQHQQQQQQTKPLNLKSLRTRFALRFLKALKKINHNYYPKVAQRYHKVKLAADVSLASVVGPRRAWSRAMLVRIRPGFSSGRRGRRQIVLRPRRRPAKAARAEELRRLVPGGEEMDLQSLLDETAHYIKCLTTQVKVMRSIVNHCSTP